MKSSRPKVVFLRALILFLFVTGGRVRLSAQCLAKNNYEAFYGCLQQKGYHPIPITPLSIDSASREMYQMLFDAKVNCPHAVKMRDFVSNIPSLQKWAVRRIRRSARAISSPVKRQAVYESLGSDSLVGGMLRILGRHLIQNDAIPSIGYQFYFIDIPVMVRHVIIHQNDDVPIQYASSETRKGVMMLDSRFAMGIPLFSLADSHSVVKAPLLCLGRDFGGRLEALAILETLLRNAIGPESADSVWQKQLIQIDAEPMYEPREIRSTKALGVYRFFSSMFGVDFEAVFSSEGIRYRRVESPENLRDIVRNEYLYRHEINRGETSTFIKQRGSRFIYRIEAPEQKTEIVTYRKGKVRFRSTNHLKH